MKHFLTGAILLCCFTSFSQDSAQKGNLNVTGSVDVYFRYNFHNAKDSGHTNNYTSFTNSQSSFELGMTSIKADYSIGKVMALVDLGFGRRAEEFSYNDGDLDQNKNGFISLTDIKQAFISYTPTDKVTISIGKWFTHVGYEVPDAYLNRNYSMSYLFSYGPFFHTGLKVNIHPNNNFGVMLAVANPTDFSSANFAKKNFLAQLHLTTTDSKLSVYLNYIGGKDMSDVLINQFDAVIMGIISNKFGLGYNGSIKTAKPESGNKKSWWGSALYLNFDPLSEFGLTARAEYFGDKKSVAGFGTNIFDFTLSANIHIENLTLTPEFRTDIAKDPLFYKNTNGLLPTAKSTGTFILAATYHF